jgi:hypothetical protein
MKKAVIFLKWQLAVFVLMITFSACTNVSSNSTIAGVKDKHRESLPAVVGALARWRTQGV